MKLLCAIDGSKHSQWALEWLPRICFPSESSLLLVHAVDVTQFKELPKLGRKARSALVEALDLSLEGAARLLESAERKVAKGWGTVRAALLRGRPAEAIARAAVRQAIDLIVIGSRGLSDFRPTLMGSVSRKLLMYASCPVLVVKKRLKALDRVIIGVDGSKESWAAVEFLRLLPVPKRAQVTVVTVIPPLPFESGLEPWQYSSLEEHIHAPLREQADKLVARVAGVVRKAGLSATETSVRGNPAAEIIKLADSERADLIVIGSRGRETPREYLMGSVSANIVKHASCSVLVFRR